MAAFTASVTGLWSQTATWGGSGPPGNGDTITINAGVVVTVSDNRTVGHSPAAGDVTKAILIAATGQLVINTGITLTVRGDLSCSNSDATRSVVMNAGSILEMDASAAGVPATALYVINCPTQATGAQPCFYVGGTVGSRCTIRSNSGGGNARFTGAVSLAGLIDASYCDFLRMGNASNKMMTLAVTATSFFSLVECTFTSCGEIDFNSTQIGTNATFIMQNCTFVTSVATTNLTSFMYTARTTGTRSITGCVFDQTCFLYAPRELTCSNNVFYKNFTTGSTNAVGGTFTNNLVCQITSFDTCSVYCADINGNYFLNRDAAATNPHFLQVGWADLATQTVRNNVFEFVGNDTQGDCILFAGPASAVTITINNNLVLPNGANDNSGTPFSALGNANVTFSCDHNTWISGTQGAAISETYAGRANMLSSFRSNIAWSPTANSGYKLHDSPVDNEVIDYVTAATCDYNCGYNLTAGNNGKGYSDLEFSSGTPGDHDIDVNPQFFDSARDIAKWDTSKGGAGTYTNALTELMKKNTSTYNSSYTISSLISYVQAGFRVRNKQLRNAGHDGATIGAQGYVSSKNPSNLINLCVG